MKSKQIDLIVVFLLLLITAAIWLIFNLKALAGGALYTVIPSVYLILREKKNYLKIFWATLIFGLIFGFIFDFLAVFNDAWIVPQIIPWKILGIEPLDNLIGYALMALFIVVFYEHFLDDEKNKRISKNLIWALIPSIIVLIVILILLAINSIYIRINYVYLAGGIAAIIYPIFVSIYKPKLIPKFLMIGAFFFIVWFIAEIVALNTSGWTFPGHYIGQVSVFGVTFPFEELFFWMMLYTPSVTAFYEFFVDDMK